MSIEDNGLRKVAIVVLSLDSKSADLVLDQMPVETAEQVRRAIFDLEPIDPKEQRCVIDEFIQSAPRSVNRQEAEGSVSFSRVGPSDAAGTSAPSKSQMFQSLSELPPRGIAEILATERPQTIALVLSHLEPEFSGQILVQFPPRVQSEVFRRLIDLEETDLGILAEIESSLQVRLQQAFTLPRRRVAGLSAVEGILDASDRDTGSELYRNLASHDQTLASQLKPERLDFSDLERLDYADLQELLDAVESDLLSLALVGASPTLLHRLLAALPASRAAALRHELNHPVPTRLSDVEAARERIGLIAQKIGIRHPQSALASARRQTTHQGQFSRQA